MSSHIKSRLYPFVGVIVLVALLVTTICMTFQRPLANTLAAAEASKAKPTETISSAYAAVRSGETKQVNGKEESAPAKQGTANLPLKRVVLFSSGVGYFEHDGKVTDNAKVDLKFKVKDINDLLKSMVVQDFDGGHVSTVGYGSNDPLDKRLSSFAVNLNGNPTLAQLLEQIRGEKVETDAPNRIVGTIVSIETRKTEVAKDHFIDQTVMNVSTDSGLRSVILESAGAIRLLNPTLDAELRKALGVLATAHETDKKTVSLDFRGEGNRNVRVGYIEETPIWKTSYRLVLGEDKNRSSRAGRSSKTPARRTGTTCSFRSSAGGRFPSPWTSTSRPTSRGRRPTWNYSVRSAPRPMSRTWRSATWSSAALPMGAVEWSGSGHGPSGARGQEGDGAVGAAPPEPLRRKTSSAAGMSLPNLPAAVEPQPGRGVGGHGRQCGRALPVCYPHAGHALAARIGHAPHRQ